MADEDHTPKSDLRAVPETETDPESAQKDAPLPAFIYGRDGQGDGNGRGGSRTGDRQNFNARIADMDRKTLLGLITGAGMLGLVLFFAGMLVGAGLFMDSDERVSTTQSEPAQVETLASVPDEPAVTKEPVTEQSTTVAAPEISADSTDPVGDLIAQRTEALEEETPGTPETDAATEDDAKASDPAEMAETQAAEPDAGIAAPEIRDVASAPDAPEVPEAPAATEAEETTAADEAAESAEQAPAVEAEEQTAATETAATTPDAEPETLATESTPPAATDGDKPFSVQVGAFKVHENASQRAEELRKEGLEVAVVVRGPEEEGAWYYVRIGSYASLADARDDAAKIKSEHSLDGFPVRAEPNDRVVD